MEYLEDNTEKLQEHFNEILMFAGNNSDKEFDFMEKEIFSRILKLGQSLIQGYVDSANTEDFGKHIEISFGEKLTHQGKRKTTILSIFGDISVERDYYQNPGQDGFFPLDKKLNLSEKKFSYLLERFCMMSTVKDSYKEAKDSVYKTFGINLPESSIQIIAKKSSAYFEDFYKEKEVSPPQEDDLLVISADGKGIPMRKDKATEVQKKKRLRPGEKETKKKMAIVGTVYTVKPDKTEGKRTFKPENKRVWAFLENKERTYSLIKSDIKSRLEDITVSPTLLFIADGGRDLWKKCKELFSDAVEILDWYHMSEYLWKAVYVFYKEGSDEAVNWIREMEQKMRSGKVSDVIKGIRVRITKNKIKGNKLKTLNIVLTYFENNKVRMKYNEYFAKGYPIGSGNVEAACKHLVKDRMEKTGMRWKITGAQSVLSLRALHINDDLESYWEYYTKSENNKLYGKMVA